MNQVKIGRFIAEMRKQQNLTQRQLADALGVSDKTISKWECGKGMPEVSFMQSICKILKIDLNELFSGKRLTDADYKKKAECELPTDYFDLVYSVYGIGWTTNLEKTFEHIYSYLRKDGVFVFGWSHPIHKCVSVEAGKLIFRNSYFNEEWYCAYMGDKEIMLSNRMLSTYINALANTGFVIEKLIEESDREKAIALDDDFGRKALMLPTAFVLKARKA